MSKPPRLSLASIVAAAAPPPRAPVEPPSAPAAPKRATLKERAHQLSVYLEPPVYDQLRDIGYTERLKMHQLMLEALDLLFKARGARSIDQLTRPH